MNTAQDTSTDMVKYAPKITCTMAAVAALQVLSGLEPSGSYDEAARRCLAARRWPLMLRSALG